MITPKLIVNAFGAALYGSFLIALLIFFLNEDLGSGRSRAAHFLPLWGVVAAVYVPALALLLPALFSCLRFFAVRRLSLGWLTPKAMIWFGVSVLGAAAGLYLHNAHTFSALLSPEARAGLRSAGMLLAGAWVVAAALASLGQVAAAGTASRLRAGAAAALLTPVLLLPPLLPAPRRAPREEGAAAPDRMVEGGAWARRNGRGLLLVGIEGASLDYVLPMVSRGELPAFGRMLKEGAAARLSSIHPCEPIPAWTALATGTPPWVSGVRQATICSPRGAGLSLQILPRGLGAGLLRGAGLIRCHGIEPSRRVSGHGFAAILRSAGLVVPSPGWEGIWGLPALRDAPRVDGVRVQAHLETITGRVTLPGDAQTGRLRGVLREAIAQDLRVHDATLAARRLEGGRALVAPLYRGLGGVTRHFLRYHAPEEFGDVSPTEQADFGGVLTRYHQFLDTLLGEQIEATGGIGHVMVVSAFGVEPIPAYRRLVESVLPSSLTGPRPLPSGDWERGPDGLLLILGPGVAAGTRLDDARIEDVLPTALYAVGMPIARDMKGDLLRRLFDRGFLEANPVHYIPAYGEPRAVAF